MRRLLVIAAAAILPLVLGAATSVVVAWALAVHDSLPPTQQTPAAWPAGEHGAIIRFARANLGLTYRSYHYVPSAFVNPGTISVRQLRSASTARIPRAEGEPPREVVFVPESNVMRISAYGLPFRCVYSLEWREDSGGCFPPARVESRGYFSGRWCPSLPCLPAWPGLLANTAIYGAPWYALFLIPALRRVRRRGRGLCPRCAYSRDGLPINAPCPECGAC